MELREINKITLANHDGLIPFSMQQSEDGYYSLTTKQPIEIFHLNYKHSEDSEMRLLATTAETPKTIVTQMIPIDAFKLYHDASDQEKPELCLDVALMPEISQMKHNPVTIQVKWAPINSFLHSYLACLTNNGGCSIKYRIATDREWNSIADISRIWFLYYFKDHSSQYTKFSELWSIARDIQITAIAWNNKTSMNKNFLACITVSGKLVIFRIKSQSSGEPVEIQMVSDLLVQKVNEMQWFTVNDTSILVIGDIFGNIALYEVLLKFGCVEYVHKRMDLWTHNDKLRCSNIQIDFDVDSNKIFILTCKGAHLLVFFVEIIDFKIIDMKTYYVGNLFLSGIVKIQQLSYALCTLGGTIKLVKISIINSEITINYENISCNVDFDKYALYGMAVSPNQALWFLALFPRQVRLF